MNQNVSKNLNLEGSWYDSTEPETKWLVAGLIPSDDICGFIGKPKSGKSTGIRNLAVAVITGGNFLGREISIQQGRVLYIHLDRKDRRTRVHAELRGLGIAREDRHRLCFRSEQDLPPNSTFDSRCSWLCQQVIDFKPNLIVIDMLMHFLKASRGVNDYDSMLDAINHLQDRLNGVGYNGVLLVSLHSRKTTSEDVGDDVLGSTGIRGSLSTGVFFRQYKNQKIYTVQSDQTQRDPQIGELEETIVNRDSGTGTIVLGAKFADLKGQEKKDEWDGRRQRVYRHIQHNPGRTSEEIADTVLMSKKTVLALLKAMERPDVSLIYSSGSGKKGDPKKYYIQDVGLIQVQAVAVEAQVGGAQ